MVVREARDCGKEVPGVLLALGKVGVEKIRTVCRRLAYEGPHSHLSSPFLQFEVVVIAS